MWYVGVRNLLLPKGTIHPDTDPELSGFLISKNTLNSLSVYPTPPISSA